MNVDDLLLEQQEELEQIFEDCKVNDPERIKGFDNWYAWAETFDFVDDDFGCTANRNRHYTVYGIDLDEDAIRALEQQEEHILDEKDIKELMEAAMRKMIDNAVRDYCWTAKEKVHTEEVYVGEFKLDDKVDITDPCYDTDVWCRTTTKCQPGLYKGYAYISDEGIWGKRVARLSIFKDDKKEDLERMEVICTIGVDAGLAGFFRDKPDYSSQDDWLAFLEKCDALSDCKRTYAIDYGIFSKSGFGDGVYDVYANKDRSAFTIVFIPEEDYEEEDDEEN